MVKLASRGNDPDRLPVGARPESRVDEAGVGEVAVGEAHAAILHHEVLEVRAQAGLDRQSPLHEHLDAPVQIRVRGA